MDSDVPEEVRLIADLIMEHGFTAVVIPYNIDRLPEWSVTIKTEFEILYSISFGDALRFQTIHPLLDDFDIYLSEPDSLDKISKFMVDLVSRKNKDYNCGLEAYNDK